MSATWQPRKGSRYRLHASSDAALPDLLPQHVFVVSAVNPGIHLLAIATPEESAALDPFAEKYGGGLGHQQNLSAARALCLQVIVLAEYGLGYSTRQLIDL